MQTVVALVLLITQSIGSWGVAVEQYIEHTVTPAPVASTAAVSSSTASSSTQQKVLSQKQTVAVSGVSQAPTASATSNLSPSNVFLYTNIQRYKAGSALLSYNATLEAMAQRKAHDLIEKNYFAHVSPTGVSINNLADDAGYTYLSIGENLAFGGFKNASEVVTAWMNSPDHRKNMLSTTFTQIGVAVERGMIDGDMGFVVVQEFGIPRSTCPPADTALSAKLTDLKQHIAVLDATLANLQQSLQQASRASDYAARVDRYNAAVKERNAIVADYRAGTTAYNQRVADINTCIAAHVKK